MKILIAEDDFTSRFVLRCILEKMGDVEVYEAEDGLKAWEMLQGGLMPGLCFLDFNMPRMNGVELLRRMRNDPRFAALKVCFCSAVRDRQVIMSAAALQPGNYILKPYDRAVIHAEVQKVRGTPRPEDSLENPAEVCARLGIDQPTYESRLKGTLEEVRALTTRLPTLLLQLDVEGVTLALEQTKQSAQALGLRRIFRLADGMSRTFKSDGSRGVDSANEMSSKLQQCLGRSAENLMQIMSDMRAEAVKIEGLVAESHGGRSPIASAPDPFKDRQRAELDALICNVSEAFRRGKLLAATRNIRSKSLNVPLRASLLGQDAALTTGALTRRISFSLTLLDVETAEAIENCRKITDLVKLLSFPLDAGARWIPDAAIRLLEQEVSSRNEQGIMLLRHAIGPDFEEFMRKEEVIIREHLVKLYEQSGTGGRASEAQVQEILQDVRERLQPALDGELTTHPVFSDLDLGNLAERNDDSRWASPFSLLQNAALLFRNAATDPSFDRTFKFSTFDRQTFLESMDVFGDHLGKTPNPERAVQELQQLKAVSGSPVSLLEKCRLTWAIIKGGTESESAAPEIRSEALPTIPGGQQTAPPR